MSTFIEASETLDLTVDEILECLNLTVEDAEAEDLTVDESIEALEDSGLDLYEDDWKPGCDSVANYCDSYDPYYD